MNEKYPLAAKYRHYPMQLGTPGDTGTITIGRAAAWNCLNDLANGIGRGDLGAITNAAVALNELIGGGRQ